MAEALRAPCRRARTGTSATPADCLLYRLLSLQLDQLLSCCLNRHGDIKEVGCALAASPTERLSLLPDGRIAYLLRKPERNGATHLVMTPVCILASEPRPGIDQPRGRFLLTVKCYSWNAMTLPHPGLRCTVETRPSLSDSARRRHQLPARGLYLDTLGFVRGLPRLEQPLGLDTWTPWASFAALAAASLLRTTYARHTSFEYWSRCESRLGLVCLLGSRARSEFVCKTLENGSITGVVGAA